MNTISEKLRYALVKSVHSFRRLHRSICVICGLCFGQTALHSRLPFASRYIQRLKLIAPALSEELFDLIFSIEYVHANLVRQSKCTVLSVAILRWTEKEEGHS